MIAAWLLLGGPALAADCAERHAPAAVATAVDEALLVWPAANHAGFDGMADRALGMVDCLSEPVTPQLAASLHRLGGMRLLVAGNEDLARRSLVAAIALDPSYTVPASLAPSGSPLAELWTQAATFSRPERTPLGLGGMNTRVDGTVGADRPYAGPYVLQIESNGRIAFSDYQLDGAPVIPAGVRAIVSTERAMAFDSIRVSPTALTVPRTASAASPVRSAPPVGEAPRTGRAPPTASSGGGKGLLWAGVASGGVAAGLYGTAAVTRLQYDRSPSGTTQTLTNGAYFSSIGTAALSGVLISTFLVTR